ncbi:MAG TPA: class I SAM-dependent methyltransferase, partial [Deltaproteobacteria bacterium]|nr:class I SAM-dependent methyltransferase [Deltaproteobacteria bacterium]
NILEYSYKNRGLPISFSDEPKDRQDFLDEGRYLISRIAAGKGTPFFWGIRLLIYPKKTLHEYKEQVLSLISLHSLARVHCIPIVREELLKVLPEDITNQISAFAERLGQKRIDREMTLYSPVLRLSTYMKQFRDPNHPFRYKIPDVLAVNILNLSGNNPEIWWFDGIYSEHNKEDLANEAEKIIRILCKTIVEHYTPVVWSEYSMQNIPVVPVAKKISEIEIDFFSLPYFSKWLRTILSSSDESSFSRLKKWFSKEAEILRKITKKEKIIKALDVGCGWGRHMELLLRSGVQYVAGVDASPAMVMKANNLYRIYPGKVSIRLERAEDMSFESSFFDLVICMTNTFGNFSKRKEKVLKEMVRTLRPGGILVLSVYKHSDEALDLRIQSYKAIGLHPACIDGKTVYTTEGLVAEQFTEQEINSMLSNHGIITEHVEYVRNLALIFVGRKTES